MKQKIYLIPGLGFDDRIFHRLKLNNCEVNYINWIEPKQSESIESYALRMSSYIKPDDRDILLIGHSFGGVMSQEISKLRPVKQIILISSIKNRSENPWYFKIVNPFSLHKFFTKQGTLSTFWMWRKRNDYISQEEQDLFKSMVAKQSNNYLQWALNELSKWDNQTPSATPITHIHGTDDKTLPYKLVKKLTATIEKGSHFMVFKRADELSVLINEAIKKN